MHYNPVRLLDGGVRDTGANLPYRDESVVDRIVGVRRKAQQIGTAFYDWPLWQAYCGTRT